MTNLAQNRQLSALRIRQPAFFSALGISSFVISSRAHRFRSTHLVYSSSFDSLFGGNQTLVPAKLDTRREPICREAFAGFSGPSRAAVDGLDPVLPAAACVSAFHHGNGAAAMGHDREGDAD